MANIQKTAKFIMLLSLLTTFALIQSNAPHAAAQISVHETETVVAEEPPSVEITVVVAADGTTSIHETDTVVAQEPPSGHITIVVPAKPKP